MKTRKAAIKGLSECGFRIVLQEGRKQQIRRMVEAVGNIERILPNFTTYKNQNSIRLKLLFASMTSSSK